MTRQSLLLLASALSTAPPTSITAFSAARTNVASSSASRTSTTVRKMSVLDSFFGKKEFAAPCVMGEESIMSQKAHGTSETPVQKDLRWNCDYDTADRICNFNRHYAEHAGYWTSTTFVAEAQKTEGEIEFYDSNSGKELFVAPRGRDMESFLKESVS